MSDVIFRCIHRHTIDSHPKCFAEGRVNLPHDMTDLKWERETGMPWYTYPGYKIGYLDIEVDNLKANFGNMLSWAIKEKDGPVTTDVITKAEIFDETYDHRIVQSIVDEMQKYKIIVTYYGTGFDIPYIRTKAMKYNMPFPGYSAQMNSKGRYFTKPEICHFDLYYTVRNKMCLHRKSLAVVTEYLGIEGKTPIKHDVWMRAKYGNVEALEEVLDHNIADVVILEELHERLVNLRAWTRKGI